MPKIDTEILIQAKINWHETYHKSTLWGWTNHTRDEFNKFVGITDAEHEHYEEAWHMYTSTRTMHKLKLLASGNYQASNIHTLFKIIDCKY